MAKKGILISFEGGEGGGKSTQIVRIRERLTKAGYDVIAVREPGGTAVGEQIREVVLSSKNTGISFTTEVLLFQAARAQIYREIVLPSLKAGKVVLMDRTRDSSVAYQGVVRKFGKDLIEQLNNMSTQNTYPDLTFLLDVPEELGLERRAKAGGMDRLDMEAKNFHTQVRRAYLDLAAEDTTGRWVIIDARQSLDDVENDIWQQIQKKLK
ncbi:dTMP kinase [Patescibacteria group bacterium]|nr:dTMP kinase [Patescibacteria group bacterium]